MEFWAFVTSGNLETFKFQGPVIEFNPDYWHFDAQFDFSNAIPVVFSRICVNRIQNNFCLIVVKAIQHEPKKIYSTLTSHYARLKKIFFFNFVLPEN